MTAFLFDSTSNQVIKPKIYPSTNMMSKSTLLFYCIDRQNTVPFIKTTSSAEHKNGAIIGVSVLLLNVRLCPLTDLLPPGWRGE